MTRRSAYLALLSVVLLPVLAFSFGGWAVITVEDLPDYAVAGKPLTLSFMVRQHGMTVLTSLRPSVTAKAGEAEVAANATGLISGRYAATLTLPRPGEWTIAIRSGFMNSETRLLPIRAIESGATPPRPLPEPDRGLRLFVAKGCVTCHVHAETRSWPSIAVGPELTGRRYVADYVAKFLADPESSPLSRETRTDARMPKLELKQPEIAALVAFLNAEGRIASQAPLRR